MEIHTYVSFQVSVVNKIESAVHGGLGPTKAENLEVLADVRQAVLTPTNAHSAPPIKKS